MIKPDTRWNTKSEIVTVRFYDELIERGICNYDSETLIFTHKGKEFESFCDITSNAKKAKENWNVYPPIQGWSIYVPNDIEHGANTPETKEFLVESSMRSPYKRIWKDAEKYPYLMSFLHEIGHTETTTLAMIIADKMSDCNYYDRLAEKAASEWAVEHFDMCLPIWKEQYYKEFSVFEYGEK